MTWQKFAHLKKRFEVCKSHRRLVSLQFTVQDNPSDNLPVNRARLFQLKQQTYWTDAKKKAPASVRNAAGWELTLMDLFHIINTFSELGKEISLPHICGTMSEKPSAL